MLDARAGYAGGVRDRDRGARLHRHREPDAEAAHHLDCGGIATCPEHAGEHAEERQSGPQLAGEVVVARGVAVLWRRRRQRGEADQQHARAHPQLKEEAVPEARLVLLDEDGPGAPAKGAD